MGGAKSFTACSGHRDDLDIQDLAADIEIPSTPLVRDTDIVVSLPTTGTLTAGPVTPKPDAEAVAISLGTAAELILNGSTTRSSAVKVYLLENPIL